MCDLKKKNIKQNQCPVECKCRNFAMNWLINSFFSDSKLNTSDERIHFELEFWKSFRSFIAVVHANLLFIHLPRTSTAFTRVRLPLSILRFPRPLIFHRKCVLCGNFVTICDSQHISAKELTLNIKRIVCKQIKLNLIFRTASWVELHQQLQRSHVFPLYFTISLIAFYLW